MTDRFALRTFEEVADIMGISKSGVIRSHEQTLVWLRRELNSYDFDA